MHYKCTYHPIIIIFVAVFIRNVITKAYVTRQNVLLIFIDDLRHLVDENVPLPNLSNMASSGVIFKQAYAQQALCAPSRNSMLTGRRPDSIRLYDFYSYWRDTIGNYTTIPQFFKENDYDTYSVGKIFHPGQSSNFTDDYPYSWSQYPYHPPTEKYKDAPVCKDKVTKKLQSNLVCPVTVMKQPGKSLPDLQSLDYAVNLLKTRNSSKPYLLAVGFYKPHIPLKFPKQYLEKIPIDKVKPPKMAFMPKQMPIVSWHPWTDVRQRDDIKRLNISFPMGLMPQEWTLKIRQSYYAAAMYVDDLIGVLMQYVDLRKTVVVLTSDHGWSLGENGLWAKYSNFEVALRVPLIISAPGLPHSKVNVPVELIDLFPTLVELSGIQKDIPECTHQDKSILCFEGKSLVPLMKATQNICGEIFAISQYPRPRVCPQKNSDKPRLKDITIMGYSIRTKRYRYTEWVGFNNTSFIINWNILHGIELYDHTMDPEESNNLVSTKYNNIKRYLSKLLRSRVDPQYLNSTKQNNKIVIAHL
ncbi:iduronate 2-sulfatase isoform X2 [Manduca sexta]|uniref:iduronate 2-sulfatase isoform X2 n=1 Tax=Manduca sexta TaxID=7130 RepID=UPI00188F11C0|nr:iduronate 2-sulfatase isoform X2 [Manduca sexta]